jgi:hypothetical protein
MSCQPMSCQSHKPKTRLTQSCNHDRRQKDANSLLNCLACTGLPCCSFVHSYIHSFIHSFFHSCTHNCDNGGSFGFDSRASSKKSQSPAASCCRLEPPTPVLPPASYSSQLSYCHAWAGSLGMDSHRLRSRNWQQNMNGAPPQQPGTNSVTQPRRALAINDMLNHPPSPGYTASPSRGFPSTQFLLSQPPSQSNFDFRSPFPPAPGQTSVPQDGLRPEAPPFYPPPPGISYPQYPVPQPPRYPPNPAYLEVPRDLPLPPQPTMNPYQHDHHMTHPPVWQSSTVPEAIPAQPCEYSF